MAAEKKSSTGHPNIEKNKASQKAAYQRKQERKKEARKPKGAPGNQKHSEDTLMRSRRIVLDKKNFLRWAATPACARPKSLTKRVANPHVRFEPANVGPKKPDNKAE